MSASAFIPVSFRQLCWRGAPAFLADHGRARIVQMASSTCGFDKATYHEVPPGTTTITVIRLCSGADVQIRWHEGLQFPPADYGF